MGQLQDAFTIYLVMVVAKSLGISYSCTILNRTARNLVMILFKMGQLAGCDKTWKV